MVRVVRGVCVVLSVFEAKEGKRRSMRKATAGHLRKAVGDDHAVPSFFPRGCSRTGVGERTTNNFAGGESMRRERTREQTDMRKPDTSAVLPMLRDDPFSSQLLSVRTRRSSRGRCPCRLLRKLDPGVPRSSSEREADAEHVGWVEGNVEDDDGEDDGEDLLDVG